VLPSDVAPANLLPMSEKPPVTSSKEIPKFKVSVVDLFCGVGGLSHGLRQEGFHIAAGVDLDPQCKYPFEANNDSKFIELDVTELTGSGIITLHGTTETRVLVGCAPCQPFSKYAQGRPENEKWNLLKEFGRLIKKSKPDIVSMENVPGLKNFKRSDIYTEFETMLKNNGYEFTSEVVYCPDYGIPQTRKRLVLLASRLGKISLIPKTHTPDKYVTVRDSIGHLPPVTAGGRDSKDPLHRARGLNEKNMLRMRAAKQGGTWRDWDPSLKLKCHSAKSGKGYVSVYGRMNWDEPSPTMTTHCTGFGNGRFGHPNQDRAITLREAAMLQSFPESYSFVEEGKEANFHIVSRLIGNAVPVTLGQVIGQSIRAHLAEVGRI
jgi:DNA (cytosine-5)-methyltransferase 1